MIATSPTSPIGVYDVTPTGLAVAEVESLSPDSAIGWVLSHIAIVDVDGDGFGEMTCFLESFGTIGGLLLIYKYSEGRYVVMKGSNERYPGSEDPGRTFRLFTNGFLVDVDGAGVPEVVCNVKLGFDSPALWPDNYQRTGPPQPVRVIWNWDHESQKFQLDHWDVADTDAGTPDDRRWRRLGPWA